MSIQALRIRARVYYGPASVLDMLCPILSLLLWSGPPIESAPAKDPAEPERITVAPIPRTPPDLHVRWEVDAPLLIGAGAIWLGTELSIEQLVPAAPRWTEATAGDLSLREALIWRSPAAARRTSDAFAFAAVPLFGLSMTLIDVGIAKQWRHLHEDLIVVLESVAVASMLTQGIKLSAARGRPYTYEVFDDPSELSRDQLFVYDADGFLSFPSGHANFAFAFTSSFATVATMRERKLAPYLWGIGMPLAGFAAYLRVAGHRHWFSDVVVGSTVGTIIGAGLPLLLHHPRFGLLARLDARGSRAQLSLLPSSTGATLVGRF